jgi:hypothetical protein
MAGVDRAQIALRESFLLDEDDDIEPTADFDESERRDAQSTAIDDEGDFLDRAQVDDDLGDREGEDEGGAFDADPTE